MYNLKELKEYFKISPELWEILLSLDIINLNHSVRVCEICRFVEKKLEINNNNLSKAGLFHDIGKYYISTKLLNKRDQLDELEKIVTKSHAYLSYKTLLNHGMNNTVCLYVLFHHSFTPYTFTDNCIDNNKITDDILKKARMLKTIDIYEALTTDRSYHRGISNEKALDIIISNFDYDAEIIDILSKNHKYFD